MKKLFVCLVMLVALMGVVSAAITMDGTISLGSDSQQKSNSNKDRVVYATKSFTVANTANSTLSNIVFTSTAGSKYNVTFTPKSISTLGPFASQTVTLTAIVPEDLSNFFTARSNPNTDRSFQIGSVIASTGSTSATSNIIMQTQNRLELTRVYVTINSGSRKSYVNGDTVENIRPGDKLTVEVDIRNRYSSNDDIRFENVQTDLVSQDSQFDIDDTLDFSSVSSGKEKTKTLTYTVDSGITEDTYAVDFTLTGTDEFGSTQGQKMRIDFQIQKLSEDIQITSASINPTEVKCDRDVTIFARLENRGSDDTTDAVLQWESTALGIKDSSLNIPLNSGDTWTRSIPITVPQSQKSGTYTIQLTTYFDLGRYDSRSIDNYGEVQLKVSDCVTTIACYSCDENGQVQLIQEQGATCPAGESLTIPTCHRPTPQINQTTTTTVPTQTQIPVATPAPVTYKQSASQNDMLYIGLIALGYLIVIIIGVALIAWAVRRK